MGCRDEFDLTPQQYHGGLDKLWDALGCKGVQDEDVFTLAANAITDARLAANVLWDHIDATSRDGPNKAWKERWNWLGDRMDCRDYPQ